MIHSFPPVEQADENGLLAIGGDLEISSLKLAYSQGIFPWPISQQYPLAWFSPNPRGILCFEDLHIPRSLKKELKKEPYTIRFNTNFSGVIQMCANIVRKNEEGTWITPAIILAYQELFRHGYAYSIEAYEKRSGVEDLVGGIYGVKFGKFYSGESMFHLSNNASKICLVHLMEHLYQNGVHWLDTQMVTSVVKQLGGKEVPRETYLNMLNLSFNAS